MYIMPHIHHFVSTLSDYAMKTMHLSGKAQIAAGIIRGREIFNLSTNYFHFYHAEAAALRKSSFKGREELQQISAM